MPLTAGTVPEVGGPLISGSDTGLNKVADDGVSTKTVGAVPCSKAARETDGTTTCIGIPDGSLRSKSRQLHRDFRPKSISSIPRHLALSPMVVFAARIEHPL